MSIGEGTSADGGSPSSASGAGSCHGSACAGRHYLAKCVLCSSAILHAVQGHFRSPSSVDIVFGKETSLELVTIGDDDVLQSVFEQNAFGIIKDIAVLSSNPNHCGYLSQDGKDLLVVLSDSGKLSFLSFSHEMHRFLPVKHIELSKPGNSRYHLARMLTVDPSGHFIAVSAYESRFAILPLPSFSRPTAADEKFLYPPENQVETSSVSNAFGTIWSMCFIGNDFHTEDQHPVLAIIMHRKGSDTNDLATFKCNPKVGVIYHISLYSEPGPMALSISAVPSASGFALIFRAGDVLLLNLKDPGNISCICRINLMLPMLSVEEQVPLDDLYKGVDVDDNVAASALLELSDCADVILKDDDPMIVDTEMDSCTVNYRAVCSWSWEPSMSKRSKIIICLDNGEFYEVELNFDEEVSLSLSDCLYRGPPSNILLWLQGRLIASIVEMGDGMILKLEDGKLVCKSSIQNIAPILDIAVADCNEEKQDHLYACCGMGPEGSVRIVRTGVNVERLLRTEPIYCGLTGVWAVKMKLQDTYHSFLVLSFVEETRVLSVGLSFNDVSEAVGFQLDVSTLACGLVADGSLVQIHCKGIKLCLPTNSGHPEGLAAFTPSSASWYPDVTISVGAVGENLAVVATSNPCFLFTIGFKSFSAYHHEIFVLQCVKLDYEVSCISIPLAANTSLLSSGNLSNAIGKICVIGTHKPSLEVLSLESGESLRVLAIGHILVNNELGCPISGCVPESVSFVCPDKYYIISGLRNGMLLKFEWLLGSVLPHSGQENKSYFSIHHCEMKYRSPSGSQASTFAVGMLENRGKITPYILQLIAVRRVGISPVMLVPLDDSHIADIIVLSDRPWLLNSGRRGLAFKSISFLPSSHVTPVRSADCPRGLLFVAENCLHLVEMVQSNRLNTQKFSLGGTVRKVIYHRESKSLLVLRSALLGTSCSDILRMDPQSGMLLSSFRFEPGEIAKCMQLAKVGNEHVLIVGTSQTAGSIIMPSGEAESSKGRIFVLSLEAQSPLECSSVASCSSHAGFLFNEIFGYAAEEISSSSLCSSPDDITCDRVQLDECSAGKLRTLSQTSLSGSVLAVHAYLERYILASAGNMLYVFGFLNENPHRLKKLATSRTRFAVTCLKTFSTRIAVGDCRDGVLFYSYHENLRKLELIYSDPAQRIVGDCALVDCETAVVSDRRGSISVLSCHRSIEVFESPEKNLQINCSFYIGETAMSIRKASIPYKLPFDDSAIDGAAQNVFDHAHSCVVASTLLGSIYILIPLTSEQYRLLEAVQEKLANFPLTSPVLGNELQEFRRREVPSGVPSILDGDMLVQFLELTSSQQDVVLASPGKLVSREGMQRRSSVSVNQVVRTLEQVHYALN